MIDLVAGPSSEQPFTNQLGDARGFGARSNLARSVSAHPSVIGPITGRIHARSPSTSDTASSVSPRSLASPIISKNRGGRKHGLDGKSRREAADLRGSACWPCAVNREKCSLGAPCVRCSRMSARSKAQGLGCDRRHLKNDMMPSFITRTYMRPIFHPPTRY